MSAPMAQTTTRARVDYRASPSSRSRIRLQERELVPGVPSIVKVAPTSYTGTHKSDPTILSLQARSKGYQHPYRHRSGTDHVVRHGSPRPGAWAVSTKFGLREKGRSVATAPPRDTDGEACSPDHGPQSHHARTISVHVQPCLILGDPMLETSLRQDLLLESCSAGLKLDRRRRGCGRMGTSGALV